MATTSLLRCHGSRLARVQIAAKSFVTVGLALHLLQRLLQIGRDFPPYRAGIVSDRAPGAALASPQPVTGRVGSAEEGGAPGYHWATRIQLPLARPTLPWILHRMKTLVVPIATPGPIIS